MKLKRLIVSILIFLELPFKENFVSEFEYDQIKFQSLFSWSYLSKFTDATERYYANIVSILIFLELPFKGEEDTMTLTPRLSFNPYFPGVTFQRERVLKNLSGST